VDAIVVDTGLLIALFDGSDRHHADALAFLQSVERKLITNFAVVTETTVMLGPSVEAQTAFLGWASRALDIDNQTALDLARIVELMTKYRDLPADFADASLVALCERLGTERIATLDRDFDVYRTAKRKRLRNVFFG
jgi:predicted nucleic acid-binding protein